MKPISLLESDAIFLYPVSGTMDSIGRGEGLINAVGRELVNQACHAPLQHTLLYHQFAMTSIKMHRTIIFENAYHSD